MRTQQHASRPFPRHNAFDMAARGEPTLCSQRLYAALADQRSRRQQQMPGIGRYGLPRGQPLHALPDIAGIRGGHYFEGAPAWVQPDIGGQFPQPRASGITQGGGHVLRQDRSHVHAGEIIGCVADPTPQPGHHPLLHLGQGRQLQRGGFKQPERHGLEQCQCTQVFLNRTAAGTARQLVFDQRCLQVFLEGRQHRQSVPVAQRRMQARARQSGQLRCDRGGIIAAGQVHRLGQDAQRLRRRR